MQKLQIKILFICFVLAFVFLFIASPDSYTHDLFQRTDSANFYTCGKSLIKGLVPYIDFADSKGPLLWLIYGIGYLINPYSYIGVFWLSTILYTFVFFYTFKIANIFLRNDKHSLYVVLFLSFSLFSPWFHYEVRSEDWLQIFIVLSFYRICFFLYTEEGKTTYETNTTCFILGVCLIGSFMIKYNCTLMLGMTYLYVLYALFKEKINVIMPFLYFFAGICFLAIPWIIYAIHLGCLNAFIQEYITNTLQTVESSNTLGEYIHEWLYLTYDSHCFFLFSVSSIGALAMKKLVKKYKYFFIFSFLCFYSIAIHRCVFLHWYYIAICLFFPIWLVIFFVDSVYNRNCIVSQKTFKRVLLSSFVYTVFSNMFFWGFLTPTWFFRDTTARVDYYKAAYFMSQIKNPTIIYYLCGTLGLETPVDGVPATTYWTTQIGATEKMMKSQINAMKSGSADFIVAADNKEYPICGTDSFIKRSGYHELMKFHANETDFILYSKHHVKNSSNDFHVSNTDVLLKRHIFRKD